MIDDQYKIMPLCASAVNASDESDRTQKPFATFPTRRKVCCQTLACYDLEREHHEMAFTSRCTQWHFRCHGCRISPNTRHFPARNVLMQGQRPGWKIACRLRPTLMRSRCRRVGSIPVRKCMALDEPYACGTTRVEEARLCCVRTVGQSAHR
jgi:hypothetical protein